MVRALYNISLRLYHVLVWISGFASEKARIWLEGRRDLWHNLKEVELHHPIWFHCSSLGEFEQGRPLIEAIKHAHPDRHILLTFFSPSGFLVRKDYPFADVTCYLPLDTPANARKFIALVKPSLVIFVKYDFWFNYMESLHKNNIPFIYISLIMASGHYLFSRITRSLLQILGTAQHIFTQDEETKKQLQVHGIDQVSIAGDTRIDRVLTLAKKPKHYPEISSITRGRFTFILGSVWEADLEIISSYINEHLDDQHLFIIASHEVEEKALQKIELFFGEKPVRFSHKFPKRVNLLSVDTIGDLAHLYQYGNLAYIGGGFGKGIHSILEPASVPLPLIFGPNHNKFREAHDLISKGGAISIRTAEDFSHAVEHFRNPTHYEKAIREIGAYMQASKGATSRILQYLVQHKLLS